MPIITLATEIHAPIERCFDLCRDLELHTRTVAHTRERLVGGKQTGLAEEGDTLIFEAVHLGVRQRLTSRITEVDSPVFFADESLSGAFRSLRHEHRFTEIQTATGPVTLMRDRLEWTSPLGLLGHLADVLFLRRYMLRFLALRNRNLKTAIEAGEA